MDQEGINSWISFYVTTSRPNKVQKLVDDFLAAKSRAPVPEPARTRPLAYVQPSEQAMADMIADRPFTLPRAVDPLPPSTELALALTFAGTPPPHLSTDFQAASLLKVLDIQKQNVTVETLRSFASPHALANLYPDPKYHDQLKYLVAMVSAYYAVATLSTKARFHKYAAELPASVLICLLTNNFKDMANPTGYDIARHVSADDSPNRFLNECTETLLFVSAMYHYKPTESPYLLVINLFLNPLREIAGDVTTAVLAELVHRYLRKLHVVGPLATPLRTHIENWTALYGIPQPDAPNADLFKRQMQDSMVSIMRLQLSNMHSPPARSDRSKPGSRQPIPSRPKNASAGHAKQASEPKKYGICTGWCLSIFYSPNCQRILGKEQCSYRDKATGKRLPLKHHDAFMKLPKETRAEMQQFFQKHIESTIPDHKVALYSA